VLKNFKLIGAELDLSHIREEVERSTLWVDMDTRPGRQKTRASTLRIQLRSNQTIMGTHYHDIHETRDLEAWAKLPRTRGFVERFAGQAGGEIGHVRVAQLRAGAEIVPHIDIGEYCAVRDRYHVVVNSPKGTQFVVGDEHVIMRENEMWWFDNKKIHSVKNLGDSPRMHIVFDVRWPQGASAHTLLVGE
jgi:hypothetical protein